MQVDWKFQPKYKSQRQRELMTEEHATGAPLCIDNVNFTDAGKYTATVSNNTDDNDKIIYTVDVEGMSTFIACCTMYSCI